jgi:hypothetical protein
LDLGSAIPVWVTLKLVENGKTIFRKLKHFTTDCMGVGIVGFPYQIWETINHERIGLDGVSGAEELSSGVC